MVWGSTFQSPYSAHSDETQAWSSFADARSLNDFCTAWLALQCSAITGASVGTILIEDEPNTFIPAAIWPDETHDVAALAQAAERALSERRGVVERGESGEAWVAYPVEARGRCWSVVAVQIEAATDEELAGALRALHWGAGWLETMFHRRSSAEDLRALAQAQGIIDVALAVSARDGASAASVSLANALAARLDCRHAAIGVTARGGIKVLAISHTAVVDRRSKLAVNLAHAMEEALDQGVTVCYPPFPGREDRIAVAHRDLARGAGLSSVVSIVMMRDSRPVGVITLGRDEPEPFDAASIRFCETAADLLGSMMVLQRFIDRPLAGRIPAAAIGAGRALLGPRHPTVKLVAICIVALVAAVTLVRTEYRVAGKVVLEGEVQRVVVAPFDGFIATAPHRAGDTVEAGETLATLDTRELALEALRFERQREQAILRQRDAAVKNDRGTAALQGAIADEADAQRALVAYKIVRATIVAPFRGLVVSGDLSQALGSPVERGKVLFEIAPLDSYRAALQIDEREIGRLEPGRRGHLLLAGLPSSPLDFTVTKTVPVPTAADGRNTFRVEAALDNAVPLLRPGMEGVGKIDAGQRSLLWIWSHGLLNWARLTAWEWLP